MFDKIVSYKRLEKTGDMVVRTRGLFSTAIWLGKKSSYGTIDYKWYSDSGDRPGELMRHRLDAIAEFAYVSWNNKIDVLLDGKD